MFSCKLPPAPLAEWPGSFTRHCGNKTLRWDGYWNNSRHRKLTPEKKNVFIPPLLPGLEPETFRSGVQRSYHWALSPLPMNTIKSRSVFPIETDRTECCPLRADFIESGSHSLFLNTHVVSKSVLACLFRLDDSGTDKTTVIISSLAAYLGIKLDGLLCWCCWCSFLCLFLW